MCAEGRPDDGFEGRRIYAGSVADAYLKRAEIVREYSIVVWRGRHIAEPTQLSDDEAGEYWLQVLRVGRAIEAAYAPVKLPCRRAGASAVSRVHSWLTRGYC